MGPVLQGQTCNASPIQTVAGCEFCCPAGELPVTSRGCLAPFCACNAGSDAPEGEDATPSANSAVRARVHDTQSDIGVGRCGPYPNWPSMTSSQCEPGGEWVNCPNFLYVKVGVGSMPP
jgi:hypothetical protein